MFVTKISIELGGEINEAIATCLLTASWAEQWSCSQNFKALMGTQTKPTTIACLCLHITEQRIINSPAFIASVLNAYPEDQPYEL